MELNLTGTLYDSCISNHGREVMSAQKFFQKIQSCEYQSSVDLFREAKAKDDKAKADQIKRSVPSFIFSSACMQGRKEDMEPESYSNLVIGDYDVHDPKVSAANREKLKDFLWVYGAYETMGHGLRVAVLCQQVPKKYYKIVLNEILKEVDKILGAKHDPKATNFYRMNAISADPHAWFRKEEECTEFFPFTPEMVERIKKACQKTKKSYAKEAEKMLDVQPMKRNDKRRKTNEEVTKCLEMFLKQMPYIPSQRNDALLHYGTWARHEGFSESDLLQLTIAIEMKSPYVDFPAVAIENRLFWGYQHPHAFTREGNIYPTVLNEYLHHEEEEVYEAEEEILKRNCPLFAQVVYDNLPQFLKDLLIPAQERREKDFLTGSTMAVMSAVMANVRFHYVDKAYSTHFAFVGVGPAGLGKGIAGKPYRLLEPIQEEMDKEYETKLRKYNHALSKWRREQRIAEKEGRELNWNLDPGEKPVQEIFIQPGICSKSSLIENLSHSTQGMIMLEPEIDTLNEAQRTDVGDCLSIYRLAFMNEPIRQKFNKDNRVINIRFPMLAASMTGTPDQFAGFVRSVNNGNLSRLAVLSGPSELVWRTIHRTYNNREHEEACNRVYEEGAKTTLEIFHFLKDHPTDVYFTEEQELRVDSLMGYCMLSIKSMNHPELASVITRGALLLGRIGSTLTGIRKALEKDTARVVTIPDDLFEVAIEMTKVFMRHTAQWSTILPEGTVKRLPMRSVSLAIDDVFNQLPEQFTSAEGLTHLKRLAQVGRTKGYELLKSWVDKGKLDSSHGHYTKIAHKEQNEASNTPA